MGLNKLNSFINKLDRFRVDDFIDEDLITQLNKDQLKEGKAANNKNLPVYKSETYVKRKKTPKTAPGGRYNMNLTGKLKESIKTRVSEGVVRISATRKSGRVDVADVWHDKLNILGIDDESRKEVRRDTIDKIRKYFKT